MMSEIIGENWKDDVDILSLYTGKKDEYLQNKEAVERLKQESDLLAKIILGGTVASSMLGLFSVINPALSLGGVALSGILTQSDYLWRVRRLYLVAKTILEEFGDENVTIVPRVKTNSAIIDLFVRMPDRRIFALMVRSSEDASIKWNENLQDFFVTKKGKNPKRYNHLTKTIEQLNTLLDLRKDRHPLMGNSYSERNAPIIKAIVLAQGAKIAATNAPEQWIEFGRARVLKVRTTSLVYVVEYDDLIKFMLLPEK